MRESLLFVRTADEVAERAAEAWVNYYGATWDQVTDPKMRSSEPAGHTQRQTWHTRNPTTGTRQ